MKLPDTKDIALRLVSLVLILVGYIAIIVAMKFIVFIIFFE